jgi:ABC-type amino acid transport substrate-binding protein
VIAALGAVSDDAGQLMFAGSSTQVNLRQGQNLRFGRRHNDGSIEWLKGLQLGGDGNSMTLRFGDGERDQLQVGMELTNAVATASGLALPQKSGLGDLLYLQQGETLQIQLSSSCGNTNTYGLVRVDVDPLNGQLSVAGVPMHDAGAFRAAVRASLLPDLQLSQGGNRTTRLSWTLTGVDGYYAPVILTQLGDVFFPGDTINRDGHRHIRSLGDGIFAFEDLAADQNSDFDFNDGLLIVSRAPAAPAEYQASSGEIAKPLYLSHDVHLQTGNANQLLHLFGDRNTVFSGGGNDTAIVYGHSANLNLGAGADRVHLLSSGGGHQIDLGRDQAADRLYLYAPDGEQPLSVVLDFDASRDQLILADGNNASRFELSLEPTMLSVLYNSKPLLQLLGSFDSSSLNTAVIRQSRTANDARQTIAERGLLMVEMESDLSGFSERDAGGLWYGYYVDQARALAEQLTGSADRLVILPSTGQSNRQARAVAQLASGRVDLALLGSGIDLDPGLAGSVQGAADDRTVLQGLLVGGAIANLSALQGQPLGVLVDSNGVAAIETYLLDRGIRAQLQSFTDSTALMAAYRAGRIQAIAGIEPLLQVYANRLGDGSRLLPDRFAPVALGALVSAQQPGLRDLVESLLQLPQTAAELGLTQRSLELVLQQANLSAAERSLIDPAVRALLELDPQDPAQPVAHQGLGAALGLARGFSRALLRRLGNANELLSRHLKG